MLVVKNKDGRSTAWLRGKFHALLVILDTVKLTDFTKQLSMVPMVGGDIVNVCHICNTPVHWRNTVL